jgi:DNA-binding GntR family transcriptional regulator
MVFYREFRDDHEMTQPLPGIQPRERVSDLEYVYSQLSRAIMMGEFEPGQKLKLKELSAAFNTSHMPIREALARMTVAQVVTTEPRRSVYVPFVSRKRLSDLIEVRIKLERMAITLISSSPDPQLALELEAINKRFESVLQAKEPNFKTYLAINHEFHFAIYNRCGNPELINLIEQMWMRYGPLLHGLRQGPTKFAQRDHHREMIKAIRSGNPEAASTAIENDLRDAAVQIATTLPAD